MDCSGSDPSQDERHSYEKCQYDEFLKRVKKMEELKAAKKEEAS
jgi:NADH dehydrogenase (ubiquinone) 1 beta subcomplex subunit 7